MESKVKRVKGFSNNGVKWPGQSDFDQDYIDLQIVDKVTKTGQGDHDFIIEKEVVISKRNIDDVIQADADSVGVENIIKQVLRTGDTSLLPVDKGDCHVDLVGAPETLMEVKAMGQDAESKFGDLPGDLVKGRSLAEFVENMSQSEFDAFIAAVKAKQESKKEVKDE